MANWSTRQVFVRSFLVGIAAGMVMVASSHLRVAMQQPEPVSDLFDPSVLDPLDSPRDVVLRQLESLRQTKDNAEKLIVCYSLATASNRAMTGPFWRFKQLVSQPPFAGMLGHRSALVGKESIIEDQAWVTVSLISDAGDSIAYEFVLRHVQSSDISAAQRRYLGTKNAYGESLLDAFWMTDAVLPIAIADLKG